jgi:flagellum-specific peptidoglycan hydrolase FlgJ
MTYRNNGLPAWGSGARLRGLSRYLLEGSVFLSLLYLVATKEVIVTVVLNGAPIGTVATSAACKEGVATATVAGVAAPRNTSLLKPRTVPEPARTPSAAPDFHDVAETDDPAPHISNLTLVLSPDYARRKRLSPRIVAAKKQRVQDYLDRYAAVARREMREFGIPASITLAQGLLESNAGDSKLARESNNHFGIKCRRKCRGCTCRNYSDDSHYDMFRVFTDPLESFREHSNLLQLDRYRKLKTYGKDYRKWAHGLKRAGYATDKRYAHKLIKIIEELELTRYDR